MRMLSDTALLLQVSYCAQVQDFKRMYKKYQSLYLSRSYSLCMCIYDQNVCFLNWSAENTEEELSL